MKGESKEGGGAAVPGSLGGRSTAESQPVYAPGNGFREGGERGITSIGEEVEATGDTGGTIPEVDDVL
jgi:hypothetical protein